MRTPQRTIRGFAALAATFLLAVASACSPAGTNADSAKDNGQSTKDSSLLKQVSSVFSEDQTYEVPAGTKVTIRLGQSLSSAVNEAGDEFKATLDDPIVADGRTLAPAGTEVTGLVKHAQESGKVKGKAEMTLALDSIRIDGKDYPLAVHPLTLRASGNEGKDAATIAGSAAVGAVIGAITGGGKGAAIGAAAGGGAGTGYVLLTKGKEIELSRETPVRFTLQDAAELPQANG